MTSLRHRAIALALFACLFAINVHSAFATHFRYGTISWEKVLTHTPLTEYRATVRVDVSMRWSFPYGGASGLCSSVPGLVATGPVGAGSCLPVGSSVSLGAISFDKPVKSNGSTALSTTASVNAIITGVNAATDTMYATMTVDIIYPVTSNPVTVAWQSSARLSTLLEGNADQAWRVAAIVNASPSFGTKSPRSVSLPMIQVTTGVANDVFLPSVAFDNFVNKWRFSSTAESSLFKAIPTGMTLDAVQDGLVHFTPTISGQYAVQFMITSYDTSVTPPVAKNAVPLDMMFVAAPFDPSKPVAAITTPLTTFTAQVGVPLSFQVTTGLTPPTAGYITTLNNSPLPAGATFSQPACNGLAACVGTFSWTPTLASTGTVVCFQGSHVQTGTLTTIQSPQRCVTINIGALATTLQAFPASGVASGPVTFGARLTRTIDAAPVVQRSVTFVWQDTGEVLGTGTTDVTGLATINPTIVLPYPAGRAYTAIFPAVANELLTSSASQSAVVVAGASTAIVAPPTVTPVPITVGDPVTTSAILNRILTPSDGGMFGVGQTLNFTLTPPAGPPSVLAGGPTSASGLASVIFPGQPAPGSYSVQAFFPGSVSLAGNVASPTTTFTVYQRTQLAATAAGGNEDLPVTVKATLVGLPGGTPLVGRVVTFSAPGATSVTATTDAQGVATASMVFPNPGSITYTASFTPLSPYLNHLGQAATESTTAVATISAAVPASLTVAPVATTSGQLTTLSAHLQGNGGTPIASVPVSFTVSGAGAVGTATTDANGDASVTFVAGNAGTTTYDAAFAGAPGYLAASASSTLTIGAASTSLSSLIAPSTAFVGDSLVAQTTLTRTSAPAGALSGQAVTFQLMQPSGSMLTLSATTDAAGQVSAAFPSLTEKGVYALTASYAGNSGQAASTSGSKTITVYQKTMLVMNTATGIAGAPITLTAALVKLPSGVPVQGQTVTLAAGSSSVVATTDNAGVASAPLVFATAQSILGTATFSNTAEFYADQNGNLLPTQASAPVNVMVASTNLSSLALAPTQFVGDELQVTTVLSRISAPGGALAGQPIVFTLTGPVGPGSTVQSMTGSTGAATASFGLAARGVYTVTATYGGDAAHQSSSVSQEITVYQKTRISAAAVGTTMAGVPASFTATLVAIPSNTPIAEGQVTFTTSVSGVGPSTHAVGINGVATTSFAFPNAGVVSISASAVPAPGSFFADRNGLLIGDVDSTSLAAVTVMAVPSTLSAPSLPASSLVGSPITVSSTLSGYGGNPVVGRTVSFTVTQPGGQILVLNAVTLVDGSASAVFTPAQRGAYSVSAAYAGDAALTPTTSTSASVPVYQRSTLALTAPANVVTGQSVTFTATLTSVPDNAGLAGQTVSFDSPLSGPQSSTTDGNGVATFTFTPAASGAVTASAMFQNAADYFVNDSGNPLPSTATAVVNVAKGTTALTSLTGPASSSIGNTVTVSTVLNRTDAPAGPVAGETVIFTITDPGGSTTTVSGSAITVAGGVASYTFAPALAGVHSVSASFAGSAALEASASNTASLTVMQRTSLVVAPAVGSATKPVTISATLTGVPSGAPLSGQAVAFSFSDGSWATATTNAQGVAQVTLTFATVGDYVSTATFSNAGAFYTNSTGAFPAVATTASDSVHVTNTPPTIVDLLDITASATSASGRAVSFTSTGNDAEDGALTPACNATSGATFPIGTTNVTCTVTDAAGATASDSFAITITNNAPSFTPPASLTLEATSAAGRMVTFAAPGNDLEDGPLSATCTPASGSTFAIATTSVNCTVTDVAGATASGAFTIKIQDTTGPALTLPTVTPLYATSGAGRVMTYSVSALDIVDGARTVTCSKPSGSTFPLGSTTVSCSSADTRGNSSTGTFTVTVLNNAPTFTPPANITVDATGNNGAVVTFTAVGNDIENGARTAVCTPASGTTFPIATTTVNCTVTDTAGATATGSFTVTVKEVTTPGDMRGDGYVRDNDAKYMFEFRARENARGDERATIKIRIDEDGRNWRRGWKNRDDRFESRTVDFIAFSDDPTIRPGRPRRAQVDTVTFSGVGEWNGQRNYRYEAFAQDAGEPGRHRETIRVRIFSPTGALVAEFEGDLDGGNIQSVRIRH